MRRSEARWRERQSQFSLFIIVERCNWCKTIEYPRSECSNIPKTMVLENMAGSREKGERERERERARKHIGASMAVSTGILSIMSLIMPFACAFCQLLNIVRFGLFAIGRRYPIGSRYQYAAINCGTHSKRTLFASNLLSKKWCSL